MSNCYSELIPKINLSCIRVRLGKAISHGGNTDWRGNSRDYDSFDAKEDIITILRSEGIDDRITKLLKMPPNTIIQVSQGL